MSLDNTHPRLGGLARLMRRRKTPILILLLVGGLLSAFVASASNAPTIASDLADYNPGGIVTLTGTNWQPGEAVHIVVNDTIGQTWQNTADVTADGGGRLTYTFNLPNYFVSDYDVTATGASGAAATTTFTDANPSADLDQCANDPAPSPSSDGCSASASDWVNGNLGGSKAVYFEGDSIPYRMRFDNLSLSSHTVTIEWDTTKSGKHAIDYLTTFNRTVATADPCLGVSGCGSPTTFLIPKDPQVDNGSGSPITQVAGNFTLYGGTITAVSAYSGGASFPGGDNSRRITITFTASKANPVLAWGGHISSRADWGLTNSAVAIPGSPYHTRLIDLDGSGGNQDRSLSADAVIFPGSITIVKDAQPNGATSFPFTASPSPLTSFSLVDDGTSANTKLFSNITDFKTYTVQETPIPTGWALTNIVCSVTSPNGGGSSTNVGTGTTTINMNEGENYTCTYTNVVQRVTLTVIKHVINDNGGTKTAGDFTMHVTGGSPSPANFAGAEAPGTTVSIDPNTAYSVTEDGVTGYTQTGATAGCSSANGIPPGGSATCTITNDDIAPKLHLRKVVKNDNGGTATVGDFTLTADGAGSNDLSGTSPVDSGAGLKADTWALSETGPAGYSASDWVCEGGTQNGSNITVGIGGEATCTITNDDIAPKLHLRKVVTNDNGGTAMVADFTLTANGAGSNDLSGTSPVDSGAGLKADTWALSETGPAGYSASAWVCVGGTQSGSNITVGIGGEATCTITNDDQTAHLKLVKTVTNDNGGSAQPTDFTLSASGPTPLSGAGGADSDVNAGSYTLSETNLPGYTAGNWSCTGGTFTSPDKIKLALGQSATCTIDNDDQQAYITVVKVVNNNHGGTAQPNDFHLTLAGSPVSSGVAVPVNPGTYTAGETLLSGYSFDGFSGDCNSSGATTVALGESKTCTLTNSDQQAYITVVKVVHNSHGGTAAPNDFNLTLAGNPVSSGVAVPVNPGTYTAGETLLSGYSFDGFSGDCNSSGATTVALGESKTCTLTNSDQQAYITVVKVVNNNHGGTAQPDDFHLTLAGSPVSSGVAVPVNPGTYTAGETQLSGYSFDGFSGDCNSSGATTVALGESKTCTLTNSDIAPKLHLRKVVKNDNGGTATVGDFTLTADGTGSNDLSGTSPVDSGASLQADTWALSETGPAGYSASAWVCVGGTQSGSNITVGIGGEATCTITNDDIAPKLHLRKVVKNDNGGTKTVADFTLTANGTGSNDLSGTSPVDSGAGLQADTWALSETNVYGYSASAWVCVGGTQTGSNITVGIGGEATCTITNDDQPGTIIVQKITKPVNTGSFGFTTTGTGYTGFTLPGGGQNSQTLNAGTYTVKEGTQLGWILTGIGGSTDPNTPYNCTVTGTGGSTGVGDLNTQTATINLKNGDTVTCVFENTGQGVTRTQGFWATHSQLAQIAWFGGTKFGHTFPGVANTAGIGDTAICGRPIDDLGKLMGTFWSDIAKTSTGAKRSALDQARMQLLQQLIAAELNASAFGSVPSGGTGMFAQWESALCGTNTTTIKNAQQQAASFNTAGDSATFTPGTSADSKYARSIANILFWDIIKP